MYKNYITFLKYYSINVTFSLTLFTKYIKFHLQNINNTLRIQYTKWSKHLYYTSKILNNINIDLKCVSLQLYFSK